MDTEANELLTRALHLTEDQRAELATRLLDSLDPDAEAEVESAWASEIKRRLDAFEAGVTQVVTWPEARKRIFGASDEP
ncbi:addiction module component, family protein [candidate division GN15 bacterium]|nr:addiction module component, family protein [candidate division GN15 bacterium]